MHSRFGILAGIFGFAAVALGAFGAHALRGILSEAALATFQTAVQYQFWHALGLLGVALARTSMPARALRIAGIAFVIGIVLFCGSLYGLSLSGWRTFGWFTPLGGVAFLVGWAALIVNFWRGTR
jgi:uncharacterized membrane protein YgdD (TMEM256/DUF423 family)